MAEKKFSPVQTAKGIITSISRGDYSLAASRMRQLTPGMQQQVALLVAHSLTPEERAVWVRYYNAR